MAKEKLIKANLSINLLNKFSCDLKLGKLIGLQVFYICQASELALAGRREQVSTCLSEGRGVMLPVRLRAHFFC